MFWLCLCRKGSKTGASSRCAGCQGSGMKVSIRQLGPSMIQQMQHVCADCKGSGILSSLAVVTLALCKLLSPAFCRHVPSCL